MTIYTDVFGGANIYPSEIEQVRSAPATEVVRCDQCRRILVRTAESGL